MSEVYRIFWPKTAMGTFNNGSQLVFAGDRVSFHNELMSPGFSIHAFDSRSNNEQSQLPVLQPEQEYFLLGRFSSEPENSVGLAITFFDENDGELNHIVFRTKDTSFVFPRDARNYRIELQNLNNKLLDFSDLWLGTQKTVLEISEFGVTFGRKNKLRGPIIYLIKNRRPVQQFNVDMLESGRQLIFLESNVLRRLQSGSKLVEWLIRENDTKGLKIVSTDKDLDLVSEKLETIMNAEGEMS